VFIVVLVHYDTTTQF